MVKNDMRQKGHPLRPYFFKTSTEIDTLFAHRVYYLYNKRTTLNPDRTIVGRTR